MKGMGIIEQLDPPSFSNYIKKYRNTICGRHPIGVLLNVSTKEELPWVVTVNCGSGTNGNSFILGKQNDRFYWWKLEGLMHSLLLLNMNTLVKILAVLVLRV